MLCLNKMCGNGRMGAFFECPHTYDSIIKGDIMKLLICFSLCGYSSEELIGNFEFVEV